MLCRNLKVARNQRVLWFRDGNFQGVLTPGSYRFWRRARHTKFESYDISEAECILPQAHFLAREHRKQLEEHLDIVEIGETQVALVTVNKLARRVALPGEIVALWKGVADYRVDVEDFTEGLAVPKAWTDAIQRSGTGVALTCQKKAIFAVNVEHGFEAVLILEGHVVDTLPAGRYAYWKLGKRISAIDVDRRPIEVEVNGQEILTKDRVSLRANASLHYRVTDSVRAAVDTPDVPGLAYRAVQFALRRAIGALTLDELLADKSKLGSDVRDDIATELAEVGVTVTMFGIKDVVLPGEMKTILNQVVEAEKLAEANAIRRRDETQNVRALANTAKQLEGNAMMARLKELEALQAVTSKVDTLNVYNGLDGVMEGLVDLKR